MYHKMTPLEQSILVKTRATILYHFEYFEGQVYLDMTERWDYTFNIIFRRIDTAKSIAEKMVAGDEDKVAAVEKANEARAAVIRMAARKDIWKEDDIVGTLNAYNHATFSIVWCPLGYFINDTEFLPIYRRIYLATRLASMAQTEPESETEAKAGIETEVKTDKGKDGTKVNVNTECHLDGEDDYELVELEVLEHN